MRYEKERKAIGSPCRCPYFVISLVGFVAGLLMAMVASQVCDGVSRSLRHTITITLTRTACPLQVMDYPQPALLYLVPCVLVPTLAAAAYARDLGDMVAGNVLGIPPHKGVRAEVNLV